MDKQKLLKKLEKIDTSNANPDIEKALSDQLRSIQFMVRRQVETKPKVPYYVAEWFIVNYRHGGVERAILAAIENKNYHKRSKFGLWFFDPTNNPVQTILNMEKYGYEIYPETNYIVATEDYYLISDTFKVNKNGATEYSVGRREYATVFTDKEIAQHIAALVDGVVLDIPI